MCAIFAVCIRENLSIGAYNFDDKDQLCPICLVEVCDPANLIKDMQAMTDQYPLEHTSIQRFVFAALLGIEEITQSEKFLYLQFAAALPRYQRMGIITELQKKIEATAIQKSCRFIAGVYTSKFTQKSSQNLGYKCYKEIMYTDYTDPLTNKQHFKDMQLHVSAKAMYFELKTL